MTASEKPRKKANRSGFRLSAARLSAVQALYEIEISGARSQDVLKSFGDKSWRDLTLTDPDVRPDQADRAKLTSPDPDYLAGLVEGVGRKRAAIVDLLDEVLTGDWSTERLDSLMRVLLFCAAFELTHHPEVPKRVIISEYTDLSHAFFEDKEASFAAGVLSAMATKTRPE